MRKHFLLLFLMALLPLAGWAADDLTDNPGVMVAVADIQYGQSEHANGDIRVTLDGGEISNTYWEIEGYYTANDGTGAPITLATLPVAETPRYVKIKFKGAYSGYAWGSFAVSKAKIVASVKNAEYFTKQYKIGTNPTLAAADVTATLRGTAVDAQNISTYLNINATQLNAYTYTGEDVSTTGYPITFSGITLVDEDNYELTIEERKMKITPIEITATEGTKFAFSHNYTAAYTYNASEQKPTVTITWNHDGDANTPAISLTEDKDYTVTYKVEDAAVASPTNAATYKAYITGIGNYSGTDVAVTALNFEIGKAALTVKPLPKSRVYDGTPFNAAEAQFNILGRQGADATVAVEGLTVTIANTAATVAQYTVTPVTTNATINGVALTTNYTVTTNTNTWEITKRPVTLTVGDAEMTFGASDFPTVPTATVPVATDLTSGKDAISQDEATAIVNAYTVQLLNSTDETYETELAAAATAAVGGYPEAYDATATTEPANYKVTVVKGKLTVKGATFTVNPVVASDIQYGEDYSIAFETTGTFDTDKLVFVIEGTEYAWKDRATWQLPKVIGNYQVTIKAGTVVGTGHNLGGTPVIGDNAYNIIKKQLNIVVPAVELWNGATKSILNKKYSIDVTGLKVGDENLEIELDFADAITGATITTSGSEKTITFDNNYAANGVDGAIIAKLKDGSNDNAHYFIKTLTGGNLKKTNTTDVTIDLAAATAESEIFDCAAISKANTGVTYKVTISGRKLNGGVWNALVLPFNVEAFDFCKAIGGYAVFNTLKSAENGNVKFGLWTGTLKAGEPFLVKPNENVDFDDFTYTDTNSNGQYDEGTDTYGGKTKFFQNVVFNDKTPTLTVDGVEFIGNYAATPTLTGGEGIMALQKQDDNSYKFVDVPADVVDAPFVFMGAYLNTNTNNARVFVEEADGTVTAISTIAADGVAVPAEGWYTLNGVKLQAAPTAKGVYINNGKKVVIK